MLHCTVTAKAGKVVGRSVKTGIVLAYQALGALVLNNFSSNVTPGATAPALFAAGTAILPMSDDIYTSSANSIGSYGTLTFNGGVLKNVSITPDANGTNANPMFDISGTNGQGATVSVGIAQNLDQTTGFFQLTAPTDTTSLAWFTAQGITFTSAGQVYANVGLAGATDL